VSPVRDRAMTVVHTLNAVEQRTSGVTRKWGVCKTKAAISIARTAGALLIMVDDYRHRFTPASKSQR
jgi:hypothetical protein